MSKPEEAISGPARAIHRRMRTRCRRNNPRSAFWWAHIREERGTVRAKTADADEFGTARRRRQGPARAQRKRRRKAGVLNWEEKRLAEGRGGSDLQRGNDPARPDCLVCDSSGDFDDEAFAVVVGVQCCDRSSLSDQRIEQLNM